MYLHFWYTSENFFRMVEFQIHLEKREFYMEIAWSHMKTLNSIRFKSTQFLRETFFLFLKVVVYWNSQWLENNQYVSFLWINSMKPKFVKYFNILLEMFYVQLNIFELNIKNFKTYHTLNEKIKFSNSFTFQISQYNIQI